jgi:hypothetical protein
VTRRIARGWGHNLLQVAAFDSRVTMTIAAMHLEEEVEIVDVGSRTDSTSTSTSVFGFV